MISQQTTAKIKQYEDEPYQISPQSNAGFA